MGTSRLGAAGETILTSFGGDKIIGSTNKAGSEQADAPAHYAASAIPGLSGCSCCVPEVCRLPAYPQKDIGNGALTG